MFSHLTNEETEPRDHDTGFESGWLSSEVHDLNLLPPQGLSGIKWNLAHRMPAWCSGFQYVSSLAT